MHFCALLGHLGSGAKENDPEILSSHSETTGEGDAEEGMCTQLSMGQPQP